MFNFKLDFTDNRKNILKEEYIHKSANYIVTINQVDDIKLTVSIPVYTVMTKTDDEINEIVNKLIKNKFSDNNI